MPSLPRSRSGRFVSYGALQANGSGVTIVDTPEASDNEADDGEAPDDGLLHRRALMRAPIGVPNTQHSRESPNRFLALNVPSPRHGPKRHDSSAPSPLFHIKGLVADREGNYERLRKSEEEVRGQAALRRLTRQLKRIKNKSVRHFYERQNELLDYVRRDRRPPD